MPLENLTGGALIPALNENWPLGSDFPDAGDDHIRGIKNVIKNQFPNIGNTPVTLTGAQMNQGSIPVGSRMVFFQAAAPSGWARVAGITDTSMLRVVASASAGGGNGGTDDPVLNNKVPSHQHQIQAVTSGNGSANHSHGGTTTYNGDHQHTYVENYAASNFPFGNNPTTPPVAQRTGLTSLAGSHNHVIPADGAAHTHTIPSHATDVNSSAANWVPRYLDVIVCERSAL
jgi:hypothetical protein